MKILVIGPSTTGSRGGMAAVIRGIEESEALDREFSIDIFPSFVDGSFPLRLLYSAWAYLRFLLRFRSYDLFHIHVATRGSTFRKGLYLRRVKRAGKRAILHVHGAEYLDFYDGLKGWRQKAVEDLFRQADLVLALSDRWKQELEKRFSMKKCAVLENGIDPRRFREAVSDPAENRASFLLMGRLGARKGVYDLIEAAEAAVREDPRITLTLVGDGEVEQVRALVAAKGLSSHISVFGWAGEEEKLRYLKQAGVVILPSYHEGLPVFLLEGMAAGKAVISTRVGAIPEVVTGENGILAEPGDIPALTAAMLRFSRDGELVREFSQRNREKIRAQFDIREMHDRLAGYYREVMR